jgi:hypothetical protein
MARVAYQAYQEGEQETRRPGGSWGEVLGVEQEGAVPPPSLAIAC